MFPTSKKNRDPLVTVTFFAMFAVLPFWDLLSPIVLVALVFLGITLQDQTGFFQKLKQNKSLLLLPVYFLLALISLVYTPDILESLEKCLKLTAFLFIPLAFLLANPDKDMVETAKRVFAFSCIAFCVFSLLGLGYNYLVDYEIRHYYNFVQRSMPSNYFPEDAMFLNTALIFILFGKFQKNWKLFGSLLFLIILVLYGVRLGLFIYFLIMLVYVIRNFKKLLNIKTLVVFALVVAGAVLFINKNPYVNDKFYGTLTLVGLHFDKTTFAETPQRAKEYHKIGKREAMWEAALILIKEKPILGYGAGVEKMQLKKVYDAKNINLNNNSHNQFLSTTVQYGLVGLILLIAILFSILRYSIIKKSLAFSLVLGVMFISMLTESYLEIQQGLFYFCAFASLIVYSSYHPGKKNAPQT